MRTGTQRFTRLLFSAWCGAIGLSIPHSAWSQERSARDIFAEASRSVVVVNGVDVYGEVIAQGSGVITAPSLVVTNCHVLRGAFAASVRYDHEEHLAVVKHMDAARDVCSLAVSDLRAEGRVAVLSPVQLSVGDRVYAIGAPRGLELSLSEGLVSSIRDGYLQTTAPISPGSSGGGLFDEQARLIGLTTRFLEDSQQLNFAIPVEWVRELPLRHDSAAAWLAAGDYGRLALNQLEKDISARDSAWYSCKREILLAAMRSIRTKLHPSEWASRLLGEYEGLDPTRCSAPVADSPAGGRERTKAR